MKKPFLTLFLVVVFGCAMFSEATTPKPRRLDAGEGSPRAEEPLAYDKSLIQYRQGADGTLVPFYETMPVIEATDGGWTAFSVVPSLDGGLQVAGCQLSVKTTRGSICCHTLSCTESECKFTKCERVP